MARKKAEPVETAAAPSDAEYTVVARRYRPQQFGQLVGQDAVSQALSNAIKSNRVAHAYLFTGARGTGKTSTARILAKCLNCEKGPTLTPCDACEICKGIMAGEDVDVLEIDGASNNGVDAVRDLRSNVQYRPQRARFKIYIIDEVHMLSTAAFNALLKTLEEPPAHVKFMMATTEITKIPITIRSRCQRFDFAGIGLSQIRTRLQEIVASEKMEADDEALELIAKRAGGSMRDAQSLLDQLLAFGSDKLTVERVHQLLGTAHEERIAAIATAVLAKDAKAALAQVAEAAESGLQLGELLDQLIEYWRDLMVVQAAGLEEQTLSVTSSHKATLASQAKSLSSETIMAGLDVLVTAKMRLKNTTHGRVVLEMALVRLSRLDDLVGVSQLVQMLQEGGVPNAAQRPSPTPATVVEKKKVMPPPEKPVGPVNLNADSLPVVWSQLLSTVGITLSSLLGRAVEQAISGPNTLVIRFPHGYNLSDPGRKAQVEAALKEITGQPWSVMAETLAAPTNGHGSKPAETPSQQRRRRQDEVMKLPLPARAKEVLGANMIGDPDEGFGTTTGSPPPATSANDIDEN